MVVMNISGETAMTSMTAGDAKRSFGVLLDRAQREPVTITGLPPAWLVAMAGADVGNGCAPGCRTDTGRPPFSWYASGEHRGDIG